MRSLRYTAAGLALALAALAGQAQGAPTQARANLAHYTFRGVVVTAPGANATQVQVDVRGGNKIALRQLIGAAQPLIFTVGAKTHYVAEKQSGRPRASSSDRIEAGDPIVVNVWARPHAPLAELLATSARMVDDIAEAARPKGRLFLFEGRAAAVDTTNHTVTIDVSYGNWRALYAMLGAPVRQTFTYASDDTTFLHWDSGRPHLILPTSITPGDVLTLRVFSPIWNTPLATLEASVLWRVNDHEPQSLIDAAAGVKDH
jgi:hypothetical protein